MAGIIVALVVCIFLNFAFQPPLASLSWVMTILIAIVIGGIVELVSRADDLH